MKAHEFASLVLRLMAIFCFVVAVASLQAVLMLVEIWVNHGEAAISSVGMLGTALSVIFPPLAMTFVGACLLYWAPSLGRSVAGTGSEKTITNHWSGQAFQAMMFAVAGVMIVADAVPTLCRIVGRMIYAHGHELTYEMQSKLLSDLWPELFATGIQLLIGLGLFFGSRGCSRMWHGLRTAGTPGTDP